jgi:hypothetical protein
MSLKDNLVDAIKQLIALRDGARAQILSIEADERFTQEHKEQLKQAAKQAFAASADTIASNARAQIDQARKGFQQGADAIAKNRLSPERAQAFHTAIQMIELAGKALSAGDLRELAEPFAEDPIAMAAIRGLVGREGLDGEQLPFIERTNAEGPLDSAWRTINSAASTPLTTDMGLSVVMELTYLERMPASVFEAAPQA